MFQRTKHFSHLFSFRMILILEQIKLHEKLHLLQIQMHPILSNSFCVYDLALISIPLWKLLLIICTLG